MRVSNICSFLLFCFFQTAGTFRCTFCQTEVEEDESVCPDARTLVARFNEQIEPIYALLRETEDVNLSHELLEPEPAEIPALKQRSVLTSIAAIQHLSVHHSYPKPASQTGGDLG